MQVHVYDGVRGFKSTHFFLADIEDIYLLHGSIEYSNLIGQLQHSTADIDHIISESNNFKYASINLILNQYFCIKLSVSLVSSYVTGGIIRESAIMQK